MSTENEKKPTHATFYTDGGCRPSSRGTGGWGLHGYSFTMEEAKQGSGNPKAMPGPKGYLMGETGKPKITITHYVDGCGSLIPESTNNIAELTAVLRAFDAAKSLEVQNLHLVMDSQYVKQGLEEWMRGWAANGWVKGDQQPVANAAIWKQIHAGKKELDERGVTLSCGWVKGHSGELGNDTADNHATRAIIAARNGEPIEFIRTTKAQGYWSAKADRNRLFSHPYWYFGTQSPEGVKSEDGRHIYYMGDPREDIELLGKKISDATFAVLYLKEEEPVLAKIREAATVLGQGRYQGLMIAHLNKIFGATLYNELIDYGPSILVRDYDRQRLSTYSEDSLLVVEEARPARLAYNAVEALESLERLLKEHLKPSDSTRLRKTDLTDLLYENDESKKKTVVKLKPHVTSALRSFNVDASYASGGDGTSVTNLVLTVGLDLPDRNTLAALAGDDIKVTLLTWPESAHAIRYATVIEANGDAGIWSGLYANLHMLAS